MEEIESISRQIRELSRQGQPLALNNRSGHSNTTRGKSYKKSCKKLDFGPFNRILHIDPERRIATVEPRVTMEALIVATTPFGLIPAVTPEFRGITVGGAIMGGALESGSHHFGTFNEICSTYEVLLGDGTLIRASARENPEIFYALAGSYGAFGILAKIEINLIPSKEFVHLKYRFGSPREVLSNFSKTSTFLDGIVFSGERAVSIEGNLVDKSDLPLFSQKFSSPWYYQHVRSLSDEYEEIMPLKDYLFRYDSGAFWMGAYLFRNPYSFTRKPLLGPGRLPRMLFHPLLTSKGLWKLLHKMEKWTQNRFVIQDFCIPENQAPDFLQRAIENPGVFPIWLCPLKATQTGQLFSPHYHSEASRLINIGIYGRPSLPIPVHEATRELERRAAEVQGRKALYSISTYTEQEFWQIYSKRNYDSLREKTKANGVWQEITEKVL